MYGLIQDIIQQCTLILDCFMCYKCIEIRIKQCRKWRISKWETFSEKQENTGKNIFFDL